MSSHILDKQYTVDSLTEMLTGTDNVASSRRLGLLANQRLQHRDHTKGKGREKKRGKKQREKERLLSEMRLFQVQENRADPFGRKSEYAYDICF